LIVICGAGGEAYQGATQKEVEMHGLECRVKKEYGVKSIIFYVSELGH
jgi:hypothetical protein